MMDKMTSIADAERVQKQLRERFGRIHGVRGIGVTWDENGAAWVRINIDKRLRSMISEIIPSEFDGVTIELRSVDNLKTFVRDRR
jgi:hypothetical protein